jgi:PAS domain S-box-containing protein
MNERRAAPRGHDLARRAIWPALTVLAAALVTYSVYAAAEEQRARERRTYFEYRVRDAELRIEARVRGYEEVLRAAQGALHATDLSRAQFRQFFDSLRAQERFPGVQGLGYATVIAPGGLAAHEAAIRAEGFPTYAVRPAGERATATSIIYLEPLADRNLRAFGFDMYAEATRRKALDLARDLDDMTITGRVTLLQETDRDVQAGFLMYLPVFDRSAKDDAPAARRLRGWVYMPFRMGDFMAGVLGEGAGDLALEVFDGDEPSEEARMYRGNAPARSDLVARRRLAIGHHSGLLAATALPSLEARMGADRSALVLFASSAATALLGALVLALSSGRARALALAAEREGRYRSMMTLAEDAVILLDREGHVVEGNPAFARLTGLASSDRDLPDVRAFDAHLDDAELAATIEGVRAEPRVFQTRWRRADGTLLDVEVSAGPIAIDGHALVLAIARDITARKRIETELAELNRSLEQRIHGAVEELRAKDQLLITQGRQAAMGEMIGHIAHQWRQPLNALSLLFVELEDEASAGDLDRATVGRVLPAANRLIQKMSSTISDFRDFFRPEKAMVDFDAKDQVDAAIALVRPSFEAHGVRVRVEPSEHVRVHGYPNEYSQVVLNVLTNAKEAMGEGGGEVVVRLEVEGDLGCVVVRDTGGGIAVADVATIFEPYFSTKPMGTGIGLYMSKQIIERNMGGRIRARNVDGGAEITIATPLAKGRDATARP